MPHLILFSFLLFAAWLIKKDTAQRPGISSAVWIPTIWVGILASRPVSTWIGMGGSMDTLDGSPLDRLFFLTMIGSAFVVVSRRGVNWGWLITKNWPIFLFYGFLLVSVLWANSPLSSLKRWVKEFGNIVVALVILTEANPLQAFRAVFVRCTYVLIPLSIILIRYFPSIGRTYSRYGGLQYTGVTTQKNSVGALVLVCGMVFIWDWLERTREGRSSGMQRFIMLALAMISVWLIYLSDSKTSILCLAIGAFIIAGVRLPLLRKRIAAFGIYAILATIAFFAIDQMVGITEWIVTSMGRDMTFTGRTDVWRELLNVNTDPIFGTGFLSFWDDPKYRSVLPYWVSSSAHNGYLEVYLFGGFLGIGLLSVMLLAIGSQLNRALHAGDTYAVVRFAVFVVMLIGNFSESHFAVMTPLGFIFLLITIGQAKAATVLAEQYPTTVRVETDPAENPESEEARPVAPYLE